MDTRISKILQKHLFGTSKMPVMEDDASPAAKPEAPSATTIAKDPKSQATLTPFLKKRQRFVEMVIDNMMTEQPIRHLLAGDTGLGKTTFVKQLGKLLGMPVITIEAPSAIPEHLVNIPFVLPAKVTNPNGSDKETDIVVKDEGGSSSGEMLQVVRGKSWLYDQIMNKHMLDDGAYLANIYSSRTDASTRALFQMFGGDEKTIPEDFKHVRQKYRVILFLDEYYRKTRGNVRNIFRGILDQMIGQDHLPRQVFTMYASNMEDIGGSVESQPANANHITLDYPAATAEELLFHIQGKLAGNPKLALKPEVLAVLKRDLKDRMISHNDSDTGVRTSPRRWEEIIKYLNVSVHPGMTKDEVATLKSNLLHANFSTADTESGSIAGTMKRSRLMPMMDKIIDDVVAAYNGEAHRGVGPDDPTNWRDTLMHQIQTKIKLGNERSYIPTVLGLHGVGKTTEMMNVASALNMRLVRIDCNALTVDDATGLVIPKKDAEDGVSVSFSAPPLHDYIMKMMERADQKFFSNSKIPEEKKKEYAEKQKKGEPQYILFFDELNRGANTAVMNALRRPILDKSFSDEYKIPDTAVIVAGINPTGKGTHELTGHMKDAMDQIQTMPSWSKWEAWAKKKVEDYGSKTPGRVIPESKQLAWNIFQQVVNDISMAGDPDASIGSEIGADSRPFFMKTASGDVLYVSPREYKGILDHIVEAVNRVVKMKLKDPEITTDEMTDEIADRMWPTIKGSLTSALNTHGIKDDNPDWLDDVKTKIEADKDKWLVTKNTGQVSLASILDEVLENPRSHLRSSTAFSNLIENMEINVFEKDLRDYLENLVSKEKQRIDFVLKKTHKRKSARDEVTEITDEEVDKLHYLEDELLSGAIANDQDNTMISTIKEIFRDVGGSILSAHMGTHGDEIRDDFMNRRARHIASRSPEFGGRGK